MSRALCHESKGAGGRQQQNRGVNRHQAAAAMSCAHHSAQPTMNAAEAPRGQALCALTPGWGGRSALGVNTQVRCRCFPSDTLSQYPLGFGETQPFIDFNRGERRGGLRAASVCVQPARHSRGPPPQRKVEATTSGIEGALTHRVWPAGQRRGCVYLPGVTGGGKERERQSGGRGAADNFWWRQMQHSVGEGCQTSLPVPFT